MTDPKKIQAFIYHQTECGLIFNYLSTCLKSNNNGSIIMTRFTKD
jgi:hypothetical protein